MEYNTSKDKLKLPEYGRNIQQMAEYCKTIKDREQRNRAANEVISIMGNMFPHLRDIRDFKHKLWDHLAIMTDFELDVDYPYELVKKEDLHKKQDPIPYNTNRIKIRHYGRTTERMIERAIELPDGDDKKAMVMLIANHMKKQYLTWNKNSVNDEIVKNDLERLSDGLLSLGDNTRLNNYNPNQGQNQRNQRNNKSNRNNTINRNNRNNNNRKFQKNNNRN